MAIRYNNFIEYGLSIVFFFLLEKLYLLQVFVIYPDKFNIDFDINRQLFAIGTVLIVNGFLLFRKRDMIYSLLCLLSLMLIIPNTIYYVFNPGYNLGILFSCIWLWMCIYFSSRIDLRLNINLGYSISPKYLIASVFLILIPFFIAFGFEVNLQNLILEEIYEVRIASREKGNLFTHRMYGILVNALLPFLTIYYLQKKKYFLLSVTISVLVYLFLIQASRSVLISIFLVIGFMFFNYEKKPTFILSIGILFCVINLIYPDNFVRFLTYRSLFVPPFLSDLYFDYFAGEKIFYSTNYLKGLVEYPYGDADPNKIIGLTYFNELAHPNSGFPVDPYIQMGYVGVFIYGIIIAILIRIMHGANLSFRFFGLFYFFIFNIISSELTVAFATHGVLILFLLFIFARNFDTEVKTSHA